MDQNPPRNETEVEFGPRPGEDIMDYVERESERIRRRSDKRMAEFHAVAQATIEKLKEVVFHCNLMSASVDETTARIQAIRAQDDRN